jgi:hypothetical protein
MAVRKNSAKTTLRPARLLPAQRHYAIVKMSQDDVLTVSYHQEESLKL